MKHRHSRSNLNADVCEKCGMSGLKQVLYPNRQCKPQYSKRRLKIAPRARSGWRQIAWDRVSQLAGDLAYGPGIGHIEIDAVPLTFWRNRTA